MTNNNRSEISLEISYLPCGFAYINRHSHQTLFQELTLADIVHFGLLSPPCTFPGIQIIRHSEYRFFALSSTAGYFLSGLRQLSHPTHILAVFGWIRFIYCRLGDFRCEAKFLTYEISDFMPCAHAQSNILHIKYAEKNDDKSLGISV